MTKTFKSFRRWAEVRLLDLVLFICRFAPVRPAVRLGVALGALAGRLDRRRRQVALRNLELAYGSELTTAERERIASGTYRHFGRLLIESLLLQARRDLRPLARWIEIDHFDRIERAVQEHGSVILASAHVGHWELMGALFSELYTPLGVVFKPSRNPGLTERLIRMRRSIGLEPIPAQTAVREIVRRLRSGRSVALLCDQNQKRDPLFVDFFGVPAATVATAGVLAVRLGKPVMIGFSYSTGEPLSYRGYMLPPIMPSEHGTREEKVLHIVRQINAETERFVRAHPEQWNWIHPRWRTRPPGEVRRPDGRPAAVEA